MKLILIYISIFLFSFATENFILIKNQNQHDDKKFKLHFMTVGFGSNMFEMEPVFKVEGAKFIYTSEEVWISPKQKKIKRDTLLVGDFRVSSIDSISNLIKLLQDTVIKKTNFRVMSGSACYMKISDSYKKLSFQLHNTSDTTADKIVAILNSYISNEFNKLYISNFKNKPK